jgi:hypothetical protein
MSSPSVVLERIMSAAQEAYESLYESRAFVSTSVDVSSTSRSLFGARTKLFSEDLTPLPVSSKPDVIRAGLNTQLDEMDLTLSSVLAPAASAYRDLITGVEFDIDNTSVAFWARAKSSITVAVIADLATIDSVSDAYTMVSPEIASGTVGESKRLRDTSALSSIYRTMSGRIRTDMNAFPMSASRPLVATFVPISGNMSGREPFIHSGAYAVNTFGVDARAGSISMHTTYEGGAAHVANVTDIYNSPLGGTLDFVVSFSTSILAVGNAVRAANLTIRVTSLNGAFYDHVVTYQDALAYSTLSASIVTGGAGVVPLSASRALVDLCILPGDVLSIVTPAFDLGAPGYALWVIEGNHSVASLIEATGLAYDVDIVDVFATPAITAPLALYGIVFSFRDPIFLMLRAYEAYCVRNGLRSLRDALVTPFPALTGDATISAMPVSCVFSSNFWIRVFTLLGNASYRIVWRRFIWRIQEIRTAMKADHAFAMTLL